LASDIVRQSEAPDVSGKTIQDAEENADFLNRELQYSQQLHDVLKAIEYINQLLSEVEAARNERRILDSLRLLESTTPYSPKLCVS
jgi:protein transport protein DSL1/ZW10